MSEPRVPALVLPDAPRSSHELTRPSDQIPLPPRPPEHRAANWRYSMVRIDASGRLASRALLEPLGWNSGTSLTLGLWEGAAVLVRRDPNGTATADRDLRVAVPVALRARCLLRAGDSVLMAASPPHQILLVYIVPFLHQLLSPTHEHIRSGGHSR